MKKYWTEYKKRMKEEMEKVLREDHTSEETAFSAALGTFVTVLPSLGLGIIFFIIISRKFKQINELALFIPVLIFNPLAKYPLYILSYKIGSLVVKSPSKDVNIQLTLSDQAFIATKTIIIGNIVLAFLLSITTYIIAFKLHRKYKKTDLGLKDKIIEKLEVKL